MRGRQGMGGQEVIPALPPAHEQNRLPRATSLSDSPGTGSPGFVTTLSFFRCFLDCGPWTSETSPEMDEADPWVMAHQGSGVL